MIKSILGATLTLAGIIIYMSTFIAMASWSGDGGDVRLLHSMVWDNFFMHVVLSIVSLFIGLFLLIYAGIRTNK
ncbi:hypothetical protein DH09_14000 [Bacillaceae bacterium JMAK1]|nr:hypothetical protein DH09_14000 [Bacillaceae bacterium JMAK1]